MNLVVDTAASMEVWDETVHDLQDRLQQAPFHDVQIQTIDASARGPLRAGNTITPVPGRQALLVVSDCVGPAWRDGRAVDLLDTWCRSCSTAVLQPLPSSLRHRLGPLLAPFSWRAERPATPTAWLTCRLQPGSLEEAAGLDAAGAVPVLALDDQPSTQGWVRLVTDPRTDWYHGEGIPVGSQGELWSGLDSPSPPADPHDFLRAFEEIAGPAALRLAALLAPFSLITVGLMRAAQRELIPEADEAVAEVFYGGLLERAPGRDAEVGGQRAYLLREDIAEPLGERLTLSDVRRAWSLAHEVLPRSNAPAKARSLPSSTLPSQHNRVRRDGPPLRVSYGLQPRNPRFVGREAVLKAIHTHLNRPGSDGMCVLHGLAGVGKTTTALEYAHRYSHEYDFVWWSQARDAQSLIRSLAHLGNELSIPPGPDGRPPEAAVLHRLRTGRVERGWLLVLDNADSPARLNELLPLGAGHILVTSRHISWTDRTDNHVPVPPLDRADSRALLHSLAPRLTADEQDALAARAGDLPPLLIQLGHFLAKHRLSVTEHLEELDRLSAVLLARGGPGDYEVPLAALWKQAVEELRLDSAGKHAAELLGVLSCLGTGPVSLELLSASCKPRNTTGLPAATGFGKVLHDKVGLHLAMDRLAAEALATVHDDGDVEAVEVHPALQTVMRAVVMGPNELTTAGKTALALLSAALPGDPTRPGGRARLAEIAHRLDLSMALHEDSHELVLAVIGHHAAVGDTKTAAVLARVALHAWSGRLSTEDPVIITLTAHAKATTP
ncbi:hypothetical protein BFF78_07445 [Streptomyces fodineus]|uniref:Orc1-like AAA ATPase domain-containing protein n=1 Tax=Streptomyces fodineus TaxID=1904616 RepID=A0A1D7Y5M7_9ACTN|nr:FxSxx-COOH system tetratricopeptide repeat protein [Streptomyces fodineus]AOR30905.1 hypothetical protein BFF78_07445 [Streptomyces fodineus]